MAYWVAKEKMEFAAPKNIILSAHVDMVYVTFNN